MVCFCSLFLFKGFVRWPFWTVSTALWESVLSEQVVGLMWFSLSYAPSIWRECPARMPSGRRAQRSRDPRFSLGRNPPPSLAAAGFTCVFQTG